MRADAGGRGGRGPRRLGGGLALLCLALAIYAVAIEPAAIEVTRHEMAASVSAPLRIAHLTDLHTRGLGRRERRLLELLRAEAPDLIVVTGDTLAQGGDLDQAAPLLRALRAPRGVWLVRGNWENWQPQQEERSRYAALGVRLLLNEALSAREDLWLVGLDDALSGIPDGAAFAAVPAAAPCVALFHAPSYFDRAPPRCALSLAGHTHGGQVRLPLLGPPWLPPGSGRFVAGWYTRGAQRLYVSRGLGNSILNVRFLCRPELAIVTLVPAGGRGGGSP